MLRAKSEAEGERGAATVWMLALLCVLMLALTGSLKLAQVAFARSAAATAADLAALAGAAQREHACVIANVVAAQNDARLLACEVQGMDVRVLVESHGARSSAIAGPKDNVQQP